MDALVRIVSLRYRRRERFAFKLLMMPRLRPRISDVQTINMASLSKVPRLLTWPVWHTSHNAVISRSRLASRGNDVPPGICYFSLGGANLHVSGWQVNCCGPMTLGVSPGCET